MAHPIALVLAAALAAAPATGQHALVGHAAYGGSVDGEWNGWTCVRQALLGEHHSAQVFRRGRRHLVTLERRLPEAGPRGAFTVVATAEFDVPRGHQLSEQGYCEVKGEAATPLVFAVVRGAKATAEYHPSVRAAWRIDLEADRLVKLDPKSVRCGNAVYRF